MATSFHTNAGKTYIKDDKNITIYDLFKDIVTEKTKYVSNFLNNLNKTYYYTFIIQHPTIGYKTKNLIFLNKVNSLNKKEYDDYIFDDYNNHRYNVIVPYCESINKEYIDSNINRLNKNHNFILLEKDLNDMSTINRIELLAY